MLEHTHKRFIDVQAQFVLLELSFVYQWTRTCQHNNGTRTQKDACEVRLKWNGEWIWCVCVVRSIPNQQTSNRKITEIWFSINVYESKADHATKSIQLQQINVAKSIFKRTDSHIMFWFGDNIVTQAKFNCVEEKRKRLFNSSKSS